MTQVTRKRRTGSIPHELTDASRGDRLHKVMAGSGVASRRDCEKLIADGRVRVNGQLVTAGPAWVDQARDRIEVDGKPLRRLKASNISNDFVYLLLHKPKNVICTTRDPQGRVTVLDLVELPPRTATRIFPVGRLDADSTGLLLLTNDGELANRLTHPRYGVAKQYQVTIRGILSNKDADKLKRGLYLAPPKANAQSSGQRSSMTDIVITSRHRDRNQGDRTRLLVTLQEGRNREIRRMLVRLGFAVRRLHRVAIGPVTLKGMASGQWRMLRGPEIGRLRKAAGLTS